MKEEYEKWSADTTSLEIFIEKVSNPIIELDLQLQDQEVGSWEIKPLSCPPKVQQYLLAVMLLCFMLWLRSLKFLSRSTKLGKESLTVVLSCVWVLIRAL